MQVLIPSETVKKEKREVVFLNSDENRDSWCRRFEPSIPFQCKLSVKKWIRSQIKRADPFSNSTYFFRKTKNLLNR